MIGRVSEKDLPLFTWTPPEPAAKVVPFPILRRNDIAKRHAERRVTFAPDKAKAHLDRMCEQMGQTMVKNGVRPMDAAKEIAALRGAIIAEFKARGGGDLWR